MNERASSFFAELKRRNIVRSGAFYAASAWLLVQITTQVFPFLHSAEWCCAGSWSRRRSGFLCDGVFLVLPMDAPWHPARERDRA
jgi:hypothetical protein